MDYDSFYSRAVILHSCSELLQETDQNLKNLPRVTYHMILSTQENV